MKMLYEELFLLCIHEEKMTFCPSSAASLNFFLGAAILSDLALQNRIQIKEDHRVYLLSPEPTGDPLLDETLKKIQAVANPKKVGFWMDDFEFKQKKFAAQLMEQLAAKGVLKHVDEDYSWVVPYPAELVPPASAKFNLRRRLRTLLQTQEEPDLHEIALLSLVKACYLLEQVYLQGRAQARHPDDQRAGDDFGFEGPGRAGRSGDRERAQRTGRRGLSLPARLP